MGETYSLSLPSLSWEKRVSICQKYFMRKGPSCKYTSPQTATTAFICTFPLFPLQPMTSSASNAVANGLAGAGGGIIAQIVTYPLQTVSATIRSRPLALLFFDYLINRDFSPQVNTRQQTERLSRKKKTGQLSGDVKVEGGTLAQILQVIRTEGLGGLYSGLKPSLIGTAASQVFSCCSIIFSFFPCRISLFLVLELYCCKILCTSDIRMIRASGHSRRC